MDLFFRVEVVSQENATTHDKKESISLAGALFNNIDDDSRRNSWSSSQMTGTIIGKV